jgi:HrpA-like RNA helicase
VAAESARLARLQTDLAAQPAMAAMRRQRAALPAAQSRVALLAALAANDVVVVSGATGCGKSTQVRVAARGAEGAGEGGLG